MAKDAPKHKGGRLAANVRPGQIAEGFAVQMLRPFAAIAQLAQEEDYGVDLIGRLTASPCESRSLNSYGPPTNPVKRHIGPYC